MVPIVVLQRDHPGIVAMYRGGSIDDLWLSKWPSAATIFTLQLKSTNDASGDGK